MRLQMSLAICPRCGTPKKYPEKQCKSCGLKPSSDEEKAKALILSTFYEIKSEYRGRTPEELMALSEQIRAGQFAFNSNEVDEVIRYAREVLSVGPGKVLKAIVRLFLFPATLTATVLLVLWLTKN
jgi:uncharacterized Zn finger protein (UPF0148 family)